VVRLLSYNFVISIAVTDYMIVHYKMYLKTFPKIIVQ